MRLFFVLAWFFTNAIMHPANMKLGWLTDIHLSFLDPDAIEDFMASVAQLPCDGILLSGDIGEASDVMQFLNSLDNAVQKPI